MQKESVRKKYLEGIKNRRSYAGSNHPSFGKERTSEWRASISRGNKGKLKGKSWESVLGKDRANERRLQNSHFMTQTNERLIKNRISSIEEDAGRMLLPLGFRNNVKVGRYLVDFIEESTQTIIEINGLYWHCHPKIFQPNQVNIHLGMTAEEKRRRDSVRISYLNDLGYTVIVLWEDQMELLEKIVSDWKEKKGQGHG